MIAPAGWASRIAGFAPGDHLAPRCRPPRTIRRCAGYGARHYVLVSLSGCGPKTEGPAEATPEQVCAASTTYDHLTGIIAAQAGQAVSLLGQDNVDAASAASKSAIGANLRYGSPTVQEINKDTRRIGCEALLTVTVPTRLLANSSLSVNDLAADRVTYQIEYTVQPSADGGQAVYTLRQGNDLSVVALTASLVALKKIQAAADVSRLDTAALNTATPEDDSAAETPAEGPTAVNAAPEQPAPVPTATPDGSSAPSDEPGNTGGL